MKILFIASECVPFCKTGGLADVLGALPKELRKKRHDVRVILPKYKSIRGQEFGIKDTGEFVQVQMGDRLEVADIRSTKTEKGVRVYFINHDGYFGRPGLYVGPFGDYPDNGERFAFFCRAALEACKAMQFRPDVIHVHDWQTALIPMILKVQLKGDAFFQHTTTVLTLHNMAYHGIFPKTLLPLTGFTWKDFTIDKFEYYDQINYLKAGIAYADLLTTVSPTYAIEIQSAYGYGWGLEGLLRRRANDLTGIINGLDDEEWDPLKDPFLAAPFDENSVSKRRDCKIALQKSLRLPMAPDKPVLGMVARFDMQKGIDLLPQVLPPLLNRHNLQVVILGQGERFLQHEMERFAKHYPGNVRVSSDFNEPLAHHIYGGSDFFLMPSRFEPCGISQLIALRYGAIPVASDTGGLHDTIQPATPNTGTGYLFEPGNPAAFLEAVENALKAFADRKFWSALQRRAMSACFSWDRSAEAYLAIYRKARGRGSPRKSAVRKLT